ncbi:hypothetical protein EHO57_14135 [Leptospira langatensis]|uniref:Uncharacterized protein n=1 Tax=Leptospira langatensis TaxID=2484983 RepID=A0A5R2AT50_9LEPT|nr:hypothetical protein [Leptospira langatensis]TGJ99893.1 hypothetical protein EHO57_14135 [Leptospira langatensis]
MEINRLNHHSGQPALRAPKALWYLVLAKEKDDVWKLVDRDKNLDGAYALCIYWKLRKRSSEVYVRLGHDLERGTLFTQKEVESLALPCFSLEIRYHSRSNEIDLDVLDGVSDDDTPVELKMQERV